MATFLWLGTGTALDVAADWTEPAVGPGPATVLPGAADIVTIDLTTALDATGTLDVKAVYLDGELSLSGTAAMVIGNTSLLPGTVAVYGPGTLVGAGEITGPVYIVGHVIATGGALALFGTVSGVGSLVIDAGATLFAANAVGTHLTADFNGSGGTLELFTAGASFGATIEGFATGDAIDVADATLTAASWTGSTLTVTGPSGTLALNVAGSLAAGTSLVALPDGFGGTDVEIVTPTTLSAGTGTLTMSGVYVGAGSAMQATAAGTVGLDGSLQADSLTAGGAFVVLPGGSLAAGQISLDGVLLAEGAAAVGDATATAGTLAIGAGATLAGGGTINAAVANDGVIAADGGALSLFGTVTGSGTLAIGNNATLFAADGIDGGTISFGTDATLDLADAAAVTVELAGLAAGDVIDLAFTTLDGLPIATELKPGDYTTESDGTGGTLVLLVACFCAGTHIATPAGPVPVERLRPGDLVLTPDGPQPLCWTGTRAGDAATAPELRPVRLTAGSLAPGVPARDLLVSPEHAVLYAGQLVRAVALLDLPGVSRVPPGPVAYYHLGLARHGLVQAEGAWAETFLHEGDAYRFDAEAGVRPPPGPPCAPRLEVLPLPPPGRLLGHVERIVPDGPRLHIEGWALDEAAPARPVTLLVWRDGELLTTLLANRWRADLDRAGLADGRCSFFATLEGPAAGLTVTRAADGAMLPQSIS